MTRSASGTGRRLDCPAWCARRHPDGPAKDDHVHVSGALQVRRTILRLSVADDPETGTRQGPYVVLGESEYTLHEAEVLIAALTQLVDEARASDPAVPRMRTPGP